jgi:1,4-dihydroxy-2-naphthoate octaprenyltransferase
MKEQIKAYILASKLASVEILMFVLIALTILAGLTLTTILLLCVEIYIAYTQTVGEKKEIVNDLFK